MNTAETARSAASSSFVWPEEKPAAAQSAHSTTPWKQSGDLIYSETANICQVGEPRVSDMISHTKVMLGSKDAAEAYANAEHIVACVNGWDALTAENAALRAALVPLERCADSIPKHWKDGDEMTITVTVGQVREARAALAKGGAK
jgi:hypothetical protein